ncbi:hypothetical protein [Okeania sp. SIO2B3]|uniref:hypothetical protein n=1 Tax=Okeania sp. SIO2B3 TaxID=2607784 RepID=UPI0013C1E138|nr:hypothetical protein [Okeania sp. SIO2B3]NET40599.1 hypothetical protein [Okeania sp. SIO2B3]
MYPGRLMVSIYGYSENTLDDLKECGWAEAWRIPYSFSEKEDGEDYSWLEVYFPYDPDSDDNCIIEAYQQAGWHEPVDNPNYSDTFITKEAEDRARKEFPQLLPDFCSRVDYCDDLPDVDGCYGLFDVDFYDGLELDENGTICIMPTVESFPLEFFGFKPDGSDSL